MKELCLVSCSGGLDSTTTLSMLKLAGYENIVACHFDYGARSGLAEKMAITKICEKLDIPLKIFDISKLMKDIDSGSMLLNKDAAVTTGTSNDIKTTAAWVHNRNGLFLNIMAAFAEEQVFKCNYDKVYFLGGFLNLSESGCFIPVKGSTIMTSDNKEVDPLDIKVGDKILSFNFEKKEFEPAEVKHIYHPEHETTYKIHLTFDEGAIHTKKTLLLSKEHPLFIKNKGWVEAEKLSVGDMCYTYRECGVSQRFSHISDESRDNLRKSCIKRFTGIPHSAETNKKISDALKGKPRSEEHCKHLSESLMGKMVGEKNPMFGHIRSNTIKCWCGKIHKAPTFEVESKALKKKWEDPEYRNLVIEKVYEFWNDDEKSKKLREEKSIIQKKFVDDYVKKHGYHWSQTPEARKRSSDTIKKAIEDGKINVATLFNKGPNKSERKLIQLFEQCNLDLRYVGDGQIWMTAEGKHMNPDFINIKQKKIVEYYGGIGFFHTLEEIEDRDRKYKSIGWDHLAIIESEMNDIDKVKTKILNFMMDVHNGWIIEKIEKIDGKVEMLNFNVEPNNNFFLNKVLTHNTYPDNSEYFISSFLEFCKYATLIGDRIQPCYGLSDLMKKEQFALIKEFDLIDVYQHAISCDRAKVIDGVPCNCMKDGIPACGSGLLAYWGSKMVGMDDTKIRKFYEIDDPDFKPLMPSHLNNEPEEYDIHKIIDRIHFPKDKLDNLHKLISERKTNTDQK